MVEGIGEMEYLRFSGAGHGFGDAIWDDNGFSYVLLRRQQWCFLNMVVATVFFSSSLFGSDYIDALWRL